MSYTGPYSPTPGSVAWRALNHLETLPPGAEIMTSLLAERIGMTDPRTLVQCMLAAVKAGRVFRRQRDTHPRSPWWYSLTDYSALGKVERAMVEVPGKNATAGDGLLSRAREAAAARNSDRPVTAEGGHADERPAAAPSPEVGGLIDLHLVVRVTPQQLERLVPVLMGRAA